MSEGLASLAELFAVDNASDLFGQELACLFVVGSFVEGEEH
jgi:hypothetical protein